MEYAFIEYSDHATQIVERNPLEPHGPPQMALVEIGPRFVLTPIRILEGAFSGASVFSNPGSLRAIILVICTLHLSQNSYRRRPFGLR